MKQTLLILTLLLAAALPLRAETGTTTEGNVSTWTSSEASANNWKKVLSTYGQNSAPTTWYLESKSTHAPNDAKWDFTYNWVDSDNQFFQAGSTGLTFASKDNGLKSLTLTTDAFSDKKITNVTILQVKSGSGGTVTGTVTVGETNFTATTSSTGTTQTDFSFVGEASGTIVITLTQSSPGKQVILKGLKVTYETATTPDPGEEKPAPPTVTIEGTTTGAANTYYIGATALISAPDATAIRYTLDGSDPTEVDTTPPVMIVEGTSAQVNNLPVGSTTIKAVAADAEGNFSDVVSSSITIVKRPAGIEWVDENMKEVAECSAMFGYPDSYIFPTLRNPNNLEITYSSTNEDVATINQDGEINILSLGTTNIRATHTTTGDSEYATSQKQFTLEVMDPANISYNTDYTYNFTVAGAYGMTPQANEVNVKRIVCGDVVLEFDDSNAATSTTYRQWENTDNTYELRVYNGVAMTIAVPNDGNINSITFNGTIHLTADQESFDGKVWTPSTSAASVKFTNEGGRSDIKGIKVNFNMGKPASPMITDENTEEKTITISCDPRFRLHYQEYAPQAAPAQAPSRVADLVAEWVDTGTYTYTIRKEEKAGYGYAFKTVDQYNDTDSNEFAFLIDKDGTLTGVESALTDSNANAPVEYFDLQGRRVLNPTTGLYIRRQGTTVEKLILR